MIFFFDVNPGLELHNFISARFWNATLSVRTFSNRIRTPERLRHIDDNLFGNMSRARKQHVLMAAKGLEYFNGWVSEKTSTPKGQHGYNRSLLQALGIYNVSIHNLFLAEEMALACFTIYKILVRQMQVDQQSETALCQPSQVNGDNIQEQINL